MSRAHELEDLLELLAGCPQGVTEDVLRHGHGISVAIIDEAVMHGAAREEIDPLVKLKGVRRLFITPLGKDVLKIDAGAL